MLNKFLKVFIAIFIIGIIGVSAVLIVKKKVTPGIGLEKIYDRPTDPSKGKFSVNGQYNLLGKFWIQLKPENKKQATLIISPWLEYNGDRDFYEEMDSKRDEMKKVIRDYFSSMTVTEIRTTNEETIKTNLIARINSLLLFGKIEKILFNDLQFLEE